MAQPVDFISDADWPNTIFHSETNCTVASFYQTDFPSCLTGLLSGPPSLFLPDVQTWICTVAKLTGKATGRNWMEAVASTKEKQKNQKQKQQKRH